MAVKGDKVLINESISGSEVLAEIKIQDFTDLVITVVGKAVSVPYQHQEQIQDQLLMREALEEAIPKEPMLDEAEASGQSANAIAADNRLFDHGSPPFSTTA
jgi:hypothetical protein